VWIPPSVRIALTVTARKPTEYCLSMRYGNPVRNRNNRPLGHADISTTLNIYADVSKELKKEEFAGLDSYFATA